MARVVGPSLASAVSAHLSRPSPTMAVSSTHIVLINHHARLASNVCANVTRPGRQPMVDRPRRPRRRQLFRVSLCRRFVGAAEVGDDRGGRGGIEWISRMAVCQESL